MRPKPATILRYYTLAMATVLLTSCGDNNDKFDASGSFESEEVIISAEATGTVLQFDVEEGQELKAGQFLGYIDSTQLFLRKKQLESQIHSILSQRPDIQAQLASLRIQLESAEREQQRFTNLVKAGAATQKQLDDVTAHAETIRKQIAAQHSALSITSASLNTQTGPLEVQIEQLRDQLRKCRIISPMNGTVLTKYAEEKEMASMGKPLFKIADLSTMILRAYISGSQLPQVKLNQKVTVLVDSADGEYRELEGTVVWISDKAEFTPKTIQTKDERANLVYALKIRVSNDGTLKLGMYGEVKLR